MVRLSSRRYAMLSHLTFWINAPLAQAQGQPHVAADGPSWEGSDDDDNDDDDDDDDGGGGGGDCDAGEGGNEGRDRG